ncbi:MAG TPA: protoporphyrinogen oxidase, partial [Actinomycetota bacterium]
MPQGKGRPRVVVVGGGITGLAAAYRLMRSGSAEVTVLEAGDRLGGKIRTVDVDGLTVEAGADSFVVRKPWAVDLARELGLEEELVIPGAAGAYVWARDRLVPFIEPSAFGIPPSAGAVLRWSGLSTIGRVRALLDLYKPRRKRAGDQALGSLVGRRLGSEAANTLVSPLLAGLHAADPARLSTLATFPELLRWEQAHGSLIQGARSALKAGPASRGPMFTTVWGGLDRLVEALAESIGTDRIRTDRPVMSVARSTDGFVVESGAG